MSFGETACSLSSVDDLSSGRMIQRQIEHGYFKEVKAVNPVRDSSVVEFLLSGDGEEFTDLLHTHIKVTLKIKKSNGTDLAADSKVAPINYIGATLFEQIDVLLNDVQISNSSPNNAYRAILETLLTYDTEASKSQLQCGGFYKDTAGQMDSVDPEAANDVNKGLVERYGLVQGSKSVEFIAKLHADLFNQPKLLVNGVRMRIKLHRNKDSFCLMAASDEFKMELEDAALIVRKCKMTPSVYAQASRVDVLYPYIRVNLKDFSFPQGQQSISINNLVHGILPQRIVLAMVSNSSSNGNLQKNPFNFQHFGLQECNLNVNGSTLNGKALTFDFANSHDVDGYWSLFQSTGKMFHNAGSLINRSDYGKGYTIIVFDLSPTLCDGTYWDPDKSGDVSLSLAFEKNLTESVTLIAYLEFNSLVEITKNKKVVPHFSV